MIRIGWNNSSKHFGSKLAFEKPDRLEFCIDGLIENFNPEILIKPFDDFISNPLYLESLELVNSIHTKKHIDTIKDYKTKQIKCRRCEKTTQCSEPIGFTSFLESNKICQFCSNSFDLNNIYCFTSIDTYYTPNTFDVALEAVGTIKRLLDWLWISSDSANGCSYAFALVRPPGHHCANDPNGFCIFNNVFAGTKYAQSLGWKKVLILDVDFHHGDGTEKLIRAASDPNISFVSIHGYGDLIYPGTGKLSAPDDNILNIPLEITQDERSRLYITDEFYQGVLNTQVFPFVLAQNPDLIIISLGFDAHQNDPLEGLNITDSTYLFLAEKLKEFNKPLLFVMEGGYNVKTIRRIIPKMIEVFG
jgi:acetoin utilization deacetylase AcuC-like enzyme